MDVFDWQRAYPFEWDGSFPMTEERETLIHFWVHQDAWPRDPSGYTFLARAVIDLGKAMFGSTWAGKEPFVIWPQAINTDRNDPTAERERAYTILEKYQPAALPPASANEKQALLEIDVSLANQLITKIRTSFWENSIRFNAVVKAIVDASEAGKLRTVTRQKSGDGSLVQIPTAQWNMEGLAGRVRRCMIDPEDPFSEKWFDFSLRWIFVDQKDLQNLLLNLPIARVETQPHTDVYMSPYLRFMVEMTKRLSLSKDNQPLKKLIEGTLEEAWPDEVKKLSRNILDSMSTLMRESESQAGKGKRK